MLNELKNVLSSFSEMNSVVYGKIKTPPTDWNFFVFNRLTQKKSGTSRQDFSMYYQVHIIREDYIPEGFELDVVAAVTENTQLRLADVEISYNYILKDNSEVVVEVATITFVKAIKR